MARRSGGRIDGGLGYLQKHGVARGVFGSSSGWFWVAVIAFVGRRLRRAVGSEAVVVYQGKVSPGETLEISHLTETYGGKRLRSRRRR